MRSTTMLSVLLLAACGSAAYLRGGQTQDAAPTSMVANRADAIGHATPPDHAPTPPPDDLTTPLASPDDNGLATPDDMWNEPPEPTFTPPAESMEEASHYHLHIVFPRMDSEETFEESKFASLVSMLSKIETAKKKGLFHVVTPFSNENEIRETDLVFLGPIGPYTEGNVEIKIDHEQLEPFYVWLTDHHDAGPDFYYYLHPETHNAWYDHVVDADLLFSPNISMDEFVSAFMTQDMSAEEFEDYKARETAFSHKIRFDGPLSELETIYSYNGVSSRELLDEHGNPILYQFDPDNEQ